MIDVTRAASIKVIKYDISVQDDKEIELNIVYD
jgi:hypothetical protein